LVKMYYRTNEGSLKWAKLTFIFIGREAYIMMELHWAFRPVSQLLRERLKQEAGMGNAYRVHLHLAWLGGCFYLPIKHGAFFSPAGNNEVQVHEARTPAEMLLEFVY